MIGFWVLVSMAAIFVSTCIIYSLAEQSKENKWRARQEQIDELKKQHKNEIDGLESKINGLNGELQKKNCEIDRLNKQERQKTEENAIIDELNKKITVLEKENSELNRVVSEKGVVISSLSSSQKEQSGELNELKKENEILKSKLDEAQNTVADANLEVLNTRKEIQELQSQVIPQERDLKVELAALAELNSALKIENENLQKEKAKLSKELKHIKNGEVKKFKYDAWNKFFRKAENVLDEKYDLNSFFESIGTSRFEKAMLENIEMHDMKITAEFVPQSDKKATENYKTTLYECTCKDYKNNKLPCKHMLHLAYSIGALQMKSKKFEATKKFLLEKIKEKAKEKEELESSIKRLKKKSIDK